MGKEKKATGRSSPVMLLQGQPSPLPQVSMEPFPKPKWLPADSAVSGESYYVIRCTGGNVTGCFQIPLIHVKQLLMSAEGWPQLSHWENDLPMLPCVPKRVRRKKHPHSAEVLNPEFHTATDCELPFYNPESPKVSFVGESSTANEERGRVDLGNGGPGIEGNSKGTGYQWSVLKEVSNDVNMDSLTSNIFWNYQQKWERGETPAYNENFTRKKDDVRMLKIPRRIFDGFFTKERPATFEDEKIRISLVYRHDYLKITISEKSSYKEQSPSSLNGCKNSVSVVLFACAADCDIRDALKEAAEMVEANSVSLYFTGEKETPEKVSLSSCRYLQSHGIEPLKDRSERFKNAIYYCVLCHTHLNSVKSCINHFEALEHIRVEKKKTALEALRRLPFDISAAHSEGIRLMLQAQFLDDSLLKKRKKAIEEVVDQLERKLKNEVDEGCSLTIFGSYFVGSFAEKSDVNLSLVYPSSFTRGQILHRVIQCFGCSRLSKEVMWTVKEVTPEIERSAPSVRILLENESFSPEPIEIFIGIQCERYIRFSNIIYFFCRLRSQFQELLFLFRKWAEVCLLDNVDIGGLPKIAFDIMLIYFLQSENYLPHPAEELLAYPDRDCGLEPLQDFKKAFELYGEDKRDWDIALLFLKLLAFYVLDHDCNNVVKIEWSNKKDDDIQFNKRRIAVKDPCSSDRVMQPTVSFGPYFSDCFLASYLYLRVPRNENGPLLPYVLRHELHSPLKKKSVRQNKKQHENLELLKARDLSCVDDGYGRLPLCLKDSAGKAQEEECKAVSRELCDLLHIGENKLEENSENSLDFNVSQKSCFGSCERSAERNGFAEDSQTEAMAESLSCLFADLQKCSADTDCSSPVSFCSETRDSVLFSHVYSRNIMFELQRNQVIDSSLIEKLKELKIYGAECSDSLCLAAKSQLTPPDLNSAEKQSKMPDEEVSTSEFLLELPRFEAGDQQSQQSPGKWSSLPSQFFSFEWRSINFTANSKPEIHCSFCGGFGHSQKFCDEMQLDPLAQLQPLTVEQMDIISRVIDDIYTRCRIQQSHLKMIEALRSGIEEELKTKLKSDCRLILFGSAGNGFGLMGSDADMCLRLNGDATPEPYDSAEVISKVAKVLQHMKGIRSVKPVLNAKVPIVKVSCGKHYNGLEADISLYNELAIINTQLLRAYCDLDERVPKLGIALKEWAKACDIGDASKGSLSSYSYIIMLIHFLQRTTPPVLPFLQEISPNGEERIPYLVEGWDAYFCKPDKINWSLLNKENTGALWFQFLDYFSQFFDFRNEVVQIRQQDPLTKLDKGWQAKPMAIEDPFDLSHNLSSGIHRKTMNYIRKSFAKSRELFGTISSSQENISSFTLELYKSCLVDNGLPLDRNCCRWCRQIGHFVENCPLNKRPSRPRRQIKQLKEEKRISGGKEYNGDKVGIIQDAQMRGDAKREGDFNAKTRRQKTHFFKEARIRDASGFSPQVADAGGFNPQVAFRLESRKPKKMNYRRKELKVKM